LWTSLTNCYREDGTILILEIVSNIILNRTQKDAPVKIMLAEITQGSKMSHWNYRVIRKYHEKSDSSTYQIHEVHYDDENMIEGWTQSPVEPMGESLPELRNDIQYFLKAFQKPVLTEIIKNEKEVLVVDEEVAEINSGHYPELLDRS